MTDTQRDPLDSRWREALAPLGDSGTPARELEARVRASLAAQRAGINRPQQRRVWVALAALILVTVVAFLFRVLPGTTPVPAGPRYLLLLYEGNRFNPGSVTPEQLVGEYSAWAKGLAEGGKLVDAAELGDEERLVSGAGESTRGMAGVISGFFIVKAADLREATAIAATCPHVKYGGEVAVRPLRET